MAQGRYSHITLLTPRRLATAVAALFVLCAAACEVEPTFNRPSSWEKAASFPDDILPTGPVAAAPDGTVYIAACDISREFDPRGVLYRYDGSHLEEFYRPPYEKWYIWDIKYGFGNLWVEGGKTDNGDHTAYFAKYDGYGWHEIDVPDYIGESSFYCMVPVSPDVCWFRSWRAVYKYDKGEWRKKFEFDTKCHDMGLAVSERGTVFVPTDPRYYAGGLTVNVSDDDGATWYMEKVDSGDEKYRVSYYYNYPIASAGETLYLAARLKTRLPVPSEGSNDYLGIIERDTAPAGQGRYRLVFLASAETAPVRDFRRMAFRDTTNGRAVGYYTSVTLEHGEWVTEEVDAFAMYDPTFTGITAGYPFYWAILEEESFGAHDSFYWLCRAR